MDRDETRQIRMLWTILAFVACMIQVRPFVKNLLPMKGLSPDFFQEWVSARYYFEGLPIYAPLSLARERYREEMHDRPENITVGLLEYNGHPPTSVLLALPLAKMNYIGAHLVWTLLSLLALFAAVGIVWRQCPGLWTPWSILPLTALLLWFGALRSELLLGQINLFVLFFLTAGWAAHRSGHAWWAGFLIAAAAAIKLFPGFVFLYFAAKRQGRSLVAGAVGFLSLTALTAAILGWECYRDYVKVVLPSLQQYRVGWLNLSWLGYWNKLLNYNGDFIAPLCRSPALAWTATIVCDAIATAVPAWLAHRAQTLRERDLAFGSTVVAMLLVSPIAWDHYFTLLVLPLILLWLWIPAANSYRVAFWILLTLAWIPAPFFWRLAFGQTAMEKGQELVATPIQTATALSMQTYILTSLFIFIIFVYCRSSSTATKE